MALELHCPFQQTKTTQITNNFSSFLGNQTGENYTTIPSNIHEPIATNESSNLKRVGSRDQTRSGSTRPSSMRVQTQAPGVPEAKGSREKRRAKGKAIRCGEEHRYSPGLHYSVALEMEDEILEAKRSLQVAISRVKTVRFVIVRFFLSGI